MKYEILDLLKRVYSKQFIEEPVEIIEENVEHLLKLSDEYQIKHISGAPNEEIVQNHLT